MTEPRSDVDQYRREKLRRLERRVEYLQGERDRALVLLADALLVATRHSTPPAPPRRRSVG